MKPLGSLLLAVPVLALGLGGCSWLDRGYRPRTAPDFTLTDSDHTVSLHDFHGKVVLLNFWSAHCAPCIAEVPSLVQLQQRMGAKIVVLGVSVDTTDGDYHKFLRDHHINFATVLDADKKSFALYGATGYPETTIIDRNGIIRQKFIGPVNWNSREITDYLSKL